MTSIVVAVAAFVAAWYVALCYHAARPGALRAPLIHLTTPEGLAAMTAGQPAGWVHLRPGPRRRNRWRHPLVGWPPEPFAGRVCFYVGERWPGRVRLFYNLPHPKRCTYAVVVDVDALATYAPGGRLYRRSTDRSAVWSAEYRGPARIIERPGR